jgi:hypothetical protein
MEPFGLSVGLWTALGVAVTIIGGLFKYFSRGLEKRMDELHNTVQYKLDKQEHQLALQRIDRDMDQLRADQNSRLDRIEATQIRTEAKLDKVIEWAVEAKK